MTYENLWLEERMPGPNNMFEPPPIIRRTSRRINLQKIAKEQLPDLLKLISSQTTYKGIGDLRTHISSIPKADVPDKDRKIALRALNAQEKKLDEEGEADFRSPAKAAIAAKKLKAAERALRSRGNKGPNPGLWFGPGTRKSSRVRKAMKAEADAQKAAEEEALNAAMAAEGRRMRAAAAAAPVAAMNNIMGRFGRMNLGTLHGPLESNGLTAWNRGRTEKYLARRRNLSNEEGGGRRRKMRKTRRRKGRSRRS